MMRGRQQIQVLQITKIKRQKKEELQAPLF